MTLKNLNKMVLAVLFLTLVPMAFAIPACDNFGQDWDISVGAFGGTFPGAVLISGCRDCDGSLGCGAALPLDGAATLTSGTGGAAFSTLWSLTAFRPGSGSCVSTHWTGSLPAGQATIRGNVSNEFGPFGSMTITFGGSCRATNGGADPTRNANGRWTGGGDNSGNGMFLP